MSHSIDAIVGDITAPRLCIAIAVVYILIRRPDIAQIIGYSKNKYFSCTKRPLQLTLKDGTKTTFEQFTKSTIPSCWLNPFIFNGHLQTVWTAFAKAKVDVYYKRWLFEQEDPNFAGSFAVDFVTKAYASDADAHAKLPPRTTHYTPEEFEGIGSSDSRPMLVTLHGLSGGSHELYLREVLAKLCTEAGEWEACVVISRGCARTKVTSQILYNARATWDVRQTVKWLRKTFPNRPLYGCGFSLGANIITNYIGEEGENCEFKAAVVLSSPWNLEVSNKALQRTWIGMNIYSRAMGESLKKLFERHIEVLGKNPVFDVPAIRNLKYLHEFDDLVQGPSWGYPNASAYYRDSAATDVMFNIRIPILSINSVDDPIVSHEALPYEEVQQTPYAVLCTTELGGHLGSFQFGGGRWFASATANFLKRMARDVDFESLPKLIDPVTNMRSMSVASGEAKSREKKSLRPFFQPTRRKWHSPEN